MSAQLVTKLRPIVQVTPGPHGLHARGWSQTLTLGGGPGLHRLWELVEQRLASGIPEGPWYPASAPASVRSALDRIRHELATHDMLVEVPRDWADPADGQGPSVATATWLESVADDPLASWTRLRSGPIGVHGDGPVAWAAVRALTELGLAVDPHPGPIPAAGPGGALAPVALVAAGRCVLVGADDAVGLVLPALDRPRATTGYAELAARVGLGRPGAAPTALHSLVGAAAAHRLVCALGGLPDPGQSRGGRRGPDAGWAAATVLVARMDPLRATYHPWLGVPASADGPVAWLQDASVRLAALTDPELGLAADHDRDLLLQVPAAVQALRHGTDVVAAVAPTSELARVSAGSALVERLAGRRLGREVIAGSSPLEARGRALRRAWLELPEGTPAPASSWSDHPAARRWWKALTLHFAQPAEVHVDTLAEGVHRAVASAREPGWAVAVEATPGDAAAMAALALVGRLQWAETDPTAGAAVAVAAPTGAAPSSRDPAGPQPDWDDDAWSWPSRLAEGEADFQRRLTHRPDGASLQVAAVEDPRVADLGASHWLVEVIRP